MTKGVSSDQMTNDFVEERVQFRGTLYVLRELPMSDYDKTVSQATSVDEDTKQEKFDPVLHTKILMSKSLVEPKLTSDQLYGKGTRLVRALERKLQALYWADEPDELKNDKSAGEDEDEDEGEAPAAS